MPETLEARIQTADETVWPTFLDTAKTLAALLPNVAPGSHGEPLTTKQMAERLGISSKTFFLTILRTNGLHRIPTRARGSI